MEALLKNTRCKWLNNCTCLNTKISEAENKIPDNSKNVATQ